KENTVLARRMALIRNAIDTGRAQFALRDLRPMLAARPKDPEVQNLMGLTQMALRNYPRAIHHLKLAYKYNVHPRYALNLSSALVENGDHEKAANLVRYALKKWPSYKYKERLLHNLGYSFAKQKRDS